MQYMLNQIKLDCVLWRKKKKLFLTWTFQINTLQSCHRNTVKPRYFCWRLSRRHSLIPVDAYFVPHILSRHSGQTGESDGTREGWWEILPSLPPYYSSVSFKEQKQPHVGVKPRAGGRADFLPVSQTSPSSRFTPPNPHLSLTLSLLHALY